MSTCQHRSAPLNPRPRPPAHQNSDHRSQPTPQNACSLFLLKESTLPFAHASLLLFMFVYRLILIVKSLPTSLCQREEFKSPPFDKGGLRGIRYEFQTAKVLCFLNYGLISISLRSSHLLTQPSIIPLFLLSFHSAKWDCLSGYKKQGLGKTLTQTLLDLSVLNLFAIRHREYVLSRRH